MNPFTLHTVSSAPAGSQAALQQAQQAFGFVPNALATMAESPELVEAFNAAHHALQRSSLSAHEREVAAMTLGHELGCEYCLAFHSRLLRGLAPELVAPLLRREPLPTPRLEAVRRLTRHLVDTRGRADDAELTAFFAAGFTPRHALELVLAVGTFTLSIFSNRLTRAQTDAELAR